MLSKRRLIQLVQQQHVHGWDDPRMPTISGHRRRGVPPAAIRLFIERTGVSKADNNIDYAVPSSSFCTSTACTSASTPASATTASTHRHPAGARGLRARDA